jgi:hypothetical protein
MTKEQLDFEKVFITAENKAAFICPKCKVSITKDVSKYKDIKKAVRLKSKCDDCGHSYIVLLERRKHYRKDVNIPGLYISEKEKVKKAMTVKDLSRSGLKFELTDGNSVKIGDRLIVRFRLDDMNRTLIEKEVIVRTMRGQNMIGTEFCSTDPRRPKTLTDKAYDMAIAHYILQATIKIPVG